jgi:hypothetical protein
MFAMMMRSLVKSSLAKKLAKEIKLIKWELVTINFYYLEHKGYHFYKRNISKNYWQFTVSDDITSCTFKMYEKER